MKELNCYQCGQHIVATTQIIWRGYAFHPDCMGEAVARYRAAAEPKPEPSYYSEFEESFEDDDFYEDECAAYEEDDDLDDLIEQFDNLPDVDDEILNQIPPIQSDTLVPKEQIGTLIAGGATTLVNWEALKSLPVPEETDTFKPIPHFQLVEEIHRSLSYRRLSVVREEYAVSPDGMKCFGLIELNVEYTGVRFAIGLRNANDKSMRVGLVAGYRVMVCENKMLTGDFNPLLAKHSKNFDLLDALSIGVDRIQRNISAVSDEIERKKVTLLGEDEARSLIYSAFLGQKFPISLLRTVHHEYFVKPSFEEFKGNSLWSLENSFTSSFKKLKPVRQFEAAAKLGKFLAPHVSPF